MNIIKKLALFLIGGFAYYGIELLYRGFSHWTMIIVGGLCFVIIGSINDYLDWNDSLIKQDLLASFIILCIEFFSGVILNIVLKLNVWDYSDSFLNIYGQICFRSFIYWLILSPVGIILDDYLRYFLFNEDKPSYRLF